jgi:hypothetical protein
MEMAEQAVQVETQAILALLVIQVIQETMVLVVLVEMQVLLEMPGQ